MQRVLNLSRELQLQLQLQLQVKSCSYSYIYHIQLDKGIPTKVSRQLYSNT